MIVLQNQMRDMARRAIITLIVVGSLSLIAAMWLESLPPMRITYIRTPAYVVAGETMTVTEIGEQRAGCMPSGVARYFVMPGDKPPFALVTDANPPNAVLALKAASTWRSLPSKLGPSSRVAEQPDPSESVSQTSSVPMPVSISLRVPVPVNSPLGRVQYGEQYDYAPCGILRGLLPVHTVAGAGPWMTVLPPGSKIPTEPNQ